MSEAHHDHSELSAGVALEAAEYDTTFFAGSYQGVTPSLGWVRGRFGASATIGLYHLEENGRSVYGMGDAMAAGHAMVFSGDTVQTGVALHVMVPTGSELDGLGMGHAMVMPSAWGTWRSAPVTVTASGGYGRAMTSLSGAHDHGPAPLVDPMNLQELTWSAGAELDVGRGVTAGGRTFGAMAIGRGKTRVIGGGRVGWGTPRVSTGFELQLGLAGDPFTIRGVVETALRF
ncbi:MAG TPA: hypothetical protein VFK02_16275 [Kofleriaceae bacterium]|nr:hypothetical protein [Kofleriaceae bacterium]